MSTPYEIEHNVKPGETGRRPHNRRVDMESFFSFLSQISTEIPASGGSGETHHNPHAEPTPVDTANLFRLLQDQFATLLQTSPDADNRDFLTELIQQVDADISVRPRLHGVSQDFLDGLDRVPKKALKPGTGKLAEEKCPICAEKYCDDPHPLVVELPCNSAHRFDLECIAPWLQSRGTCPLCRKDFVKKKEPAVAVKGDSEDEEEYESMYG